MKEYCPICMKMHIKEKVSMIEPGIKDNTFVAVYYYCEDTDSYYEDEKLKVENIRMERMSRGLMPVTVLKKESLAGSR